MARIESLPRGSSNRRRPDCGVPGAKTTGTLAEALAGIPARTRIETPKRLLGSTLTGFPARILLLVFAFGLGCAGSRPDAAADRASSAAAAGRIDRPRVEDGGPVSTREARAAFRRHRVAQTGGEGARRALADLGSELIGGGYLETRLLLTPDERGGIIRVDEGWVTRWDSLHISGRFPPGTVKDRSNRLPGPSQGGPGPRRPEGTFDPARFERTLWSWVDLWNESGYPFAAATVESLVVRGGGLEAGLRFDPGDPYTVEETAYPGRVTTRPSFLDRWIRFRPGDLYRESEWRDRRARLERTGLFARVGEPLLIPLDGGGLRVAIPVEEGKHNRLEGALGFAGASETVTGFADLELGDLFGTGRSLGFHWDRFAADRSRLRLNYREPLIGPLPVGLRASLEQEDRDSTYSQTVIEGVADLWLGGDLTAFAGGEGRRSIIGPEPSERVRRVSSVVGGTWETLRPGLSAGGRLTASFRTGTSRIRPAGGGPSRSMRLQRADLEAERYLSPAEGWVIRAHLAGSALSREDSLPPSEAIRMGGAGTVRGYGEEQFATRRYGAVQLEAGPALAGSRLYAFVDAGWYRTFVLPARSRDLWGFGVGLSSEAAARTVRLDLGVPRGGTFSTARIHLRLETRF